MGQFALLTQHLPRLLPLRQVRKQAARHRGATSIADMLGAIRSATTSRQLTRAFNKVQERLWKTYPAHSTERALLADQLIDQLSTLVLFSPTTSIRTTAASLLRMVLQMGMASQPARIFATLVTATVRASKTHAPGDQERSAYLTFLFECFWPFRTPSPAYTWEQFPANSLFFPLVPLLETLTRDDQEMLLSIFAELPQLAESEFTQTLLPFALRWSQHSDSRKRQQICDILVRLPVAGAHMMLCQLQDDTDAAVRQRASYALKHTQ